MTDAAGRRKRTWDLSRRPNDRNPGIDLPAQLGALHFLADRLDLPGTTGILVGTAALNAHFPFDTEPHPEIPWTVLVQRGQPSRDLARGVAAEGLDFRIVQDYNGAFIPAHGALAIPVIDEGQPMVRESSIGEFAVAITAPTLPEIVAMEQAGREGPNGPQSAEIIAKVIELTGVSLDDLIREFLGSSVELVDGGRGAEPPTATRNTTGLNLD
jgi:hypothetical protein